MARADLEFLPPFPLPEGFSVAWYRPGDETHWLHVQVAAERFLEITPKLFWQQFGAGAEEGRRDSTLHDLSERQCFLFDPFRQIIGTGTAWFDAAEGVCWGRVHWL